MASSFERRQDEIPTEQQGLYAERDGAWVLDVEGAVEKARLEEFRNSNVALMRERDELKRRFERSESEQVQAVAAERDALNARLTAIQIDQGVTTTATKRGLRPTAIPDITARARTVFRLVDGAPRGLRGGWPDGACGQGRHHADDFG